MGVMFLLSRISHLAFLLLPILACVNCTCYNTQFNRQGDSKCRKSADNMNGFTAGPSWTVPFLGGAICCPPSSAFLSDDFQVTYKEFWADSRTFNEWQVCPDGYFLNGHWQEIITLFSPTWVIRVPYYEGRCSKPATHPSHYGSCYDHDPRSGNCKPDYFITGMKAIACSGGKCLDALRCCKMASGPDPVHSVEDVKTRIMDTTLVGISYLAHYLGYGWCAGCRGINVGEDFTRNNNTWEADKTKRCKGFKSHQLLSINYDNWSFKRKDIRFGKAIQEELKPENIVSGTLVNDDSTPSEKTAKGNARSVRSITHTATNSWTKSQEAGLEITYSPAISKGSLGFKAHYTFGYESSSSTEDSTGQQQEMDFGLEGKKTLAPHSSVDWRLIMSKVRVTVPYTATFIARFSTELRGFLRWGGGWRNPNTNYHYRYRGSEDRPTVNYPFGDKKTSFYEALKKESEAGSQPWLWSEMMRNHPRARTVIEKLTKEGLYEFTLSGTIEEVQGTNITFVFDNAKKLPHGRDRRSTGESTEDGNDGKAITVIAKAQPGDPAPKFSDPPKVVIDRGPPLSQIEIPVNTQP